MSSIIIMDRRPLVSAYTRPSYSRFNPTLFSCVFAVVCTYINTLAQAWVETADEYSGVILPDVFSSFACLDISAKFADLMLYSVWITTIIRLSLDSYEKHQGLRRFFLFQGILFLMRSVTITTTRLPNPLKTCSSEVDPKKSIFIEALFILLHMKTTCRDVLFSGHVANMVVCSWIVTCAKTSANFNDRKRKLFSVLQIAVWCQALLGAFVIVASSFHYTVDVIVAIFLSTLVVLLYFALKHVCELQAIIPNTGRDLRLFVNMIKFISWFENI